MKCEDCKFYEVGKPNAILHREGICHRYPANVPMMKSGWCGEYLVKKSDSKKKE